MILAGDEIGLTGLWFEGQKHFGYHLDRKDEELPILTQAKEWLDIYFDGQEPSPQLPLHLIGTDFQKEVWHILLSIPYGQTTTYGDIARQIATMRKIPRMSAQAVGGAVGRNPISLIVPCHRVIGTDGSLTGYAGGIDRKLALLRLETVDMTHIFLPTQ